MKVVRFCWHFRLKLRNAIEFDEAVDDCKSEALMTDIPAQTRQSKIIPKAKSAALLLYDIVS